MPDAVLETKLLLPRSLSRTVGRPRLDELLTLGSGAVSTRSCSAACCSGLASRPRVTPAIELFGAALLLTANTLTYFEFTTQTGIWTMLATIPIAT